MKLHAIVGDLATAEVAVDGGATVVQLRVKGAPTPDVVALGQPIAQLCRLAGVSFVVNDDLAAALELSADGVHLGRGDPGAEQAIERGLILGLSAAGVDEAVAAELRGATYIGAGPIWATPTKPDAESPIGLDGLAAICSAVSTPVVAIGGIDPGNAAECFAAGASGVAVVRAASESRALREVIEGAGR
jgi:thiamine-phosphate pyrophosphorylase